MLPWPFRRRVAEAERTRPERGGAPRDRVERLDPQSAYAIWARSYPPEPHNRLMEVEQAAVLAVLPDVRGLSVLDAGCGSGRYLRELTSRGATAIGMDLSGAMLDRARLTTPRVVRADLRALPFDAMSLDAVVCALALGDIEELERALAEFARVLRPGGHVIYSVVHPAGAAEGWTRTFESDGRLLAVDGYWHPLDRHRDACAAAGLVIEAWREPEIDDVSARPALLVVRANTKAAPPEAGQDQIASATRSPQNRSAERR